MLALNWEYLTDLLGKLLKWGVSEGAVTKTGCYLNVLNLYTESSF